jgi:hypothetical protein
MSDTWNATWDRLITEMLRHMIREFLAHPPTLIDILNRHHVTDPVLAVAKALGKIGDSRAIEPLSKYVQIFAHHEYEKR